MDITSIKKHLPKDEAHNGVNNICTCFEKMKSTEYRLPGAHGACTVRCSPAHATGELGQVPARKEKKQLWKIDPHVL